MAYFYGFHFLKAGSFKYSLFTVGETEDNWPKYSKTGGAEVLSCLGSGEPAGAGDRGTLARYGDICQWCGP